MLMMAANAPRDVSLAPEQQRLLLAYTKLTTIALLPLRDMPGLVLGGPIPSAIHDQNEITALLAFEKEQLHQDVGQWEEMEEIVVHLKALVPTSRGLLGMLRPSGSRDRTGTWWMADRLKDHEALESLGT
jgi:hypothetical protein